MSEEIPRAVRALWIAESPRRGPKPTMTLADIAAAGIAVADADGLAGVSMAAVAQRLGCSTMALYRYVDTKDTLLALMLDAAYGPPPETAPVTPWRDALAAWAVALLAALRAHPWALHVRSPLPPLTPHTLGWMDLGLRILVGAGLDPEAAASTLLVVDGYVRNQVQTEQQYADASTQPWAAMLRELISPGQLPAIEAGLTAGVFDDDPAEAPFPGDQLDFGLDLILGGIERLIPPA